MQEDELPRVEVVDLDECGRPVEATRRAWDDEPDAPPPVRSRPRPLVAAVGAAHLLLVLGGLGVVATGAAVTAAAPPAPSSVAAPSGDDALSLSRSWALRRQAAPDLGPDLALTAMLPARLSGPTGTSLERGGAVPVLGLPDGAEAAVQSDYTAPDGHVGVRVVLVRTTGAARDGFDDVLVPLAAVVEAQTGAAPTSAAPHEYEADGFAGQSLDGLTVLVVGRDLTAFQARGLMLQVEKRINQPG